MSVDSTTPESTSTTPTQPQTPQSRRQKRLSKHRQNGHREITIAPPSRADLDVISTSTPTSTPRPFIPTPPPAPMAPVRLLIASIGNPAPYLSTLHSAGHTVLFALASTLGTPLRQTSGRDWSHGLLSPGTPWTLWASPAPMNASGAAVARAWRTFTAAGGGAAEEPRLVVLHDELEASLGALRVRPGSASAKGHNGLRSIGEALPGVSYTRIGIGIGRPESREPGVVAGYVLRKMSGLERGRIEGVVGDVVGELRRLSGE